MHERNPDNEAFKQIFAELGNLYSAKEKAIEDVVQTLYKQQEKEKQTAAAQLTTNVNEKGTSGHTKRNRSRKKGNSTFATS